MLPAALKFSRQPAFTGPLAVLLLLAVTPHANAQERSLSEVLSRVSEEAEVFRSSAPKLLGEEKLVQRTRKPPGRFRPRPGADGLQGPKPKYRTRELISEYGFTTLADSPAVLRELRKVISVDGRNVSAGEEARSKLMRGLISSDDRAKKHMLEEFEKYGLENEAAVDFGQVILLFDRRRLDQYSFAYRGPEMIGAERADSFTFEQVRGGASLLVVGRREAVHLPLRGELWVRHSDAVPLRVVLLASRRDHGKEVREEATVDYAMSRFGCVVPVSVVQREFAVAPPETGKQPPDRARPEMIAENVFQYSPFRMFSSETQVEFKSVEEKQNPERKDVP